MSKLKSGEVKHIESKLKMAVPLDVTIANATRHEVEYIVEEVPDGSKPKLLIRLVHALKRKRR